MTMSREDVIQIHVKIVEMQREFCKVVALRGTQLQKLISGDFRIKNLLSSGSSWYE